MTFDLTINSELSIDDIIEQNKKLVTDFKQQQGVLAQSFSQNFQQILKNTFEKIPQIKAIIWTQFTPFHSDGDLPKFATREATFLSYIPKNDIYAHYSGEIEPEENHFSLPSYCLKYNDNFTEEEVKFLHEIDDIILENSDLMNLSFGNHTIIVVTQDDLQQIDYYEHH